MLIREVFLILRRNAGHSKWQNIKHTKQLKDSQRSLLYVKLCQKIKIAITENGNNSNPSSNLYLSQAIEIARKKDMPVANIQNCIKSTQIDKDAATMYRYSIKGPKGSILLVTALTPYVKKTKQDIVASLKKVGGIVAEQSHEGNFEKKGIIEALPPPGMENIEESSIDHAIEAEAEEVLPLDEENKLTFICPVGHLHKVKSKLEELNYVVEETKITFIPKMKVNLSDEEMELMSKIMTKLETIPEVVEFHDNIA